MTYFRMAAYLIILTPSRALERSGKTVERGMTLLRRMGADGRKFRIMISGMEQTATGRPRRQSEYAR